MSSCMKKLLPLLAAVFFKAGESAGLKVDAPAVMLLQKPPGGKIRVIVNDPEQDSKRNSVTITRKGKKHKIKLPSGVYCGQPANQVL